MLGFIEERNIALSVLNEVVIRTPDMTELREIIRRGRTLLGIADRIEVRDGDALRHSQRLAPSTLARAFCGERVSQDPSDESAAEFLRRLKDPLPAARRAAQARVNTS